MKQATSATQSEPSNDNTKETRRDRAPSGISLLPVILIAIGSLQLAGGAEGAKRSTASGDGEPIKAPIYGAFKAQVRTKLARAFPQALEKVKEVTSCGNLFADLEADGAETLRSTFYLPAPADGKVQVCGNGAAAYTYVGNAQTRICSGFSGLGPSEATMILIHEALHHAGLGEKPGDPDGLTSFQINSLVARSCEL